MNNLLDNSFYWDKHPMRIYCNTCKGWVDGLWLHDVHPATWRKGCVKCTRPSLEKISVPAILAKNEETQYLMV